MKFNLIKQHTKKLNKALRDEAKVQAKAIRQLDWREKQQLDKEV